MNRNNNRLLKSFFKPNGNQDEDAQADPAEDNTEMLDVDEDDVEEQPIIIIISNKHTHGVAVESPDIVVNLDINEDKWRKKTAMMTRQKRSVL